MTRITITVTIDASIRDVSKDLRVTPATLAEFVSHATRTTLAPAGSMRIDVDAKPHSPLQTAHYDYIS